MNLRNEKRLEAILRTPSTTAKATLRFSSQVNNVAVNHLTDALMVKKELFKTFNCAVELFSKSPNLAVFSFQLGMSSIIELAKTLDQSIDVKIECSDYTLHHQNSGESQSSIDFRSKVSYSFIASATTPPTNFFAEIRQSNSGSVATPRTTERNIDLNISLNVLRPH